MRALYFDTSEMVPVQLAKRLSRMRLVATYSGWCEHNVVSSVYVQLASYNYLIHRVVDELTVEAWVHSSEDGCLYIEYYVRPLIERVWLSMLHYLQKAWAMPWERSAGMWIIG